MVGPARKLCPALAQIPNVLAEPEPNVEILDLNERGTVLAVRPYCHTDHDWQVCLEPNKLIAKTFGKAGYAAPFLIEQKKG